MRSLLFAAVSLLALTAGTARAQSPSPFSYKITIGTPSSCPDDDGSAGAPSGSPNVPKALAAYADANTPHALGCKVAGVDFHTGVPDGLALKVPVASNLPAQCSLKGNVVTCAGSGWTFSGYDMTGKQLQASGSGATISNNKFVLNSGCLAPLIYSPSGTWHIEANSVDGGGPLCQKGLANGFNALLYNASGTAPGAIVYLRWNTIAQIPEDGLNFTGSSAGAAATVHVDFNLFNGEGWDGHPDGIQLTRGNFDDSTTNHNTFIKNVTTGGPQAGTQPLHIEAQLTSNVSNWTQAFNTVVTPGTCNGGNNWPPNGGDGSSTKCMANFALACKQDTSGSEKDSNTGYRAYGNYVDPTGLIAALATSSYGCTKPSAGTPFPNVDMTTGKSLSAN